MTAMRMAQTQSQPEIKPRVTPTKDLGHPPRNPRPHPSSNEKPTKGTQGYNQTSKSTKPPSTSKGKNRDRTREPSPIETPASSMPHGLTVQELKELTRMRLAREALTGHSHDNDFSHPSTRSSTTTDMESYSDSTIYRANRSTSTSPDSDSMEDHLATTHSRIHGTPPHSHYPPHHSPSADELSGMYLPPHRSPASPPPSYFHSSLLQSPPMHGLPPPTKPVSGIHPGLSYPSPLTLDPRPSPQRQAALQDPQPPLSFSLREPSPPPSYPPPHRLPGGASLITGDRDLILGSNATPMRKLV